MDSNVAKFVERMNGCVDKMKIVNLVKKPDAVIVDFGAGGGMISILLAEKFPNTTIYAIDYDPDMRALLMSKAKELNLDNIKVRDNDVLYILENQVDYVICSAVLHEALENKKMSRLDSLTHDYEFFYRVLKPSGCLIVREAMMVPTYQHANAKLKVKSEIDYHLAKDYLERHLNKSYVRHRNVSFNDERRTIFGNYYLLYGAMFAIVFGVESYIKREKDEFRFLNNDELPPNYMFSENDKGLYYKEDIINHLNEKFIIQCVPINGSRIVDETQPSNFAPTNGYAIYTSLCPSTEV